MIARLPPSVQRILPWLALLAVVVGFVNFLWFFAESIAIGGDPLNGRVVDGHYFVSSHGSETEVSRATWEWGRAHAISVFVTMAAAIVGIVFLISRVLVPAMILGSAGARDSPARVGLVRGSGLLLADATCDGRIANVRFTLGRSAMAGGSDLVVSVYPAGLVLWSARVGDRAILASEIGWVGPDRERSWQVAGFLRPTGVMLRIDHAGIGLATPVLLRVPLDSQVAREIARLGPADAPGDRPDGALRPVSRARPPTIVLAYWGFGLLANYVFVVAGFVWAIPSLGAFGLLLTGGAIAIAVVNTRRFLGMIRP